MSEDILYDIEMQLYMEFNDDIATMYDHLGDIYSYKDIEDKKQAEQQRKIELMENAIKQLQNNWNELKDSIEEILSMVSTIEHNLEKYEEVGLDHLDYAIKKVWELKDFVKETLEGNNE